MRREFKVEVNQGNPQVSYREAITAKKEWRETYKKQTGGRGKFADVQIEFSPLPEDSPVEFEFVNDTKGGSIPREFIPAVEKGIKNALKEGVIAGYPLGGVKARLFDGSFHAVDSDSLSFELAGRMAFRKACREAAPIIKEPIMSVEVVTPSDYMGGVVGDLNRRRGQMEGMGSRGNAQIVKAKVPLSELFGYVTQLRTITSGRATATMQFSHYQQAPNNIQAEVVAKSKGPKSKDDE
jgi:elongation factor G